VDDDDDNIAAVTIWLQVLNHNCFAKGFNALTSSWEKCLNRDGDYVEK
jgi:hypothetical protein